MIVLVLISITEINNLIQKRDRKRGIFLYKNKNASTKHVKICVQDSTMQVELFGPIMPFITVKNKVK